MPSLSIRRLRLRQFSWIALILLAVSIALLWQRFQLSPSAQVAVTPQSVEVDRSDSPIQPIPIALTLNPQKVALGSQLFHEPRLSQNNQVSCASCHNLSTGGVDRKARSIGFNGGETKVNASTVYNSGFNFRYNWDGKFETLAAQSDASVLNPVWMGSNWADIINKLKQEPAYVRAFEQVYDDGITADNVNDAIATFEQSLYTPNARFDQYLQGDAGAITASEKQGYELFRDYGCASCHQGVNVGGNLFQKFGVMGDYFADRGNITPADLGRFNSTNSENDRYVFRVPSLRNVALTSPYFHDGTAKTLEQAVAVMARYQLGRPLSSEQVDLIVQFLNTLSGNYQGERL